MKNRTCEICEEYERLRSQAETKKPLVQFICEHGVFVLCGPVPKTRREVDQLAREWKRHIGLTKAPGPKEKTITFYDVCNAYASLPFNASLQLIADTMKVSRDKVSQTLKRAESSIGELREMRRRGEKSILFSRLRRR